MPRLIEKYVAVVRLNRGISTALPIVTTSTISQGGVVQGTAQVIASAATIALVPTSTLLTHTPTQSETINFSAPTVIGQQITIEVVTSGVTSFTLTFGTNTKTSGTLATGTVSAKTFLITFISDGTNWIELARTAAL